MVVWVSVFVFSLLIAVAGWEPSRSLPIPPVGCWNGLNLDGWAGTLSLVKKGISLGQARGAGFFKALSFFCNKSSSSRAGRFSLCWTSYSSGGGLSKSLMFGIVGIDDLFWKLFRPKRSPPPPPSPTLLLLLLSSSSNLFIPRSLSRHFRISKSLPGWLSRDFIKSLSVCFLFKSISLSNEPTIGFSASKVEMSSKTSSKGFCLLSVYLLIRSNFCLKLASFILSLVTEWFISVCILFAKSDVARIYFWTSSFGISASAAIRE